MGSPLPPDPYLALGVSKSATTDEVKKTHRKLVLKCHPDKVTDPDAKQAASDQFHKIQTAYEILVDEERRARYDAQVKLAELRKDALERKGSVKPRSGESRTATSNYRSSSESVPRSAYPGRASERPTPQYEERRPSYATESYFDQPPRATSRKDPEYTRSSRRETKEKSSRPSTRDRKEAEKEKEREKRKEAARRAEQETVRREQERARKYNAYAEQESDSDSDDEYTRRAQTMREEDEARKARAAYHEQAYKQKQDATTNSSQYVDERTRKMFAATSDAWDYIRSSHGRQRPESERRPSPVRMSSSKDKVEYVQRGGRPAMVRRGSTRPKVNTRGSEDSKKASSREKERKSSPESGEEPPRRTLNPSRSSPADLYGDKQRSQSVQYDTDPLNEIPKMKRSETMPYNASRRAENNAPRTSSRPTETNEGLPTPAATPTDYTGPAGPNSTKYNYGRQYADDMEYPTPDGYKTELRNPPESRPKFTRKATRSPSPIKEREPLPRDTREERRDRMEKSRAASSRYPSAQGVQAPPLHPRSTSYVYTPGQGVAETAYDRSRPSSGRGADPREPRAYPERLYGEVQPPSGSPRQRFTAYEPPEEDSPRDSPRYPRRSESIRVPSSGYYKRPSTSRTGSGQPIYTSARA